MKNFQHNILAVFLLTVSLLCTANTFASGDTLIVKGRIMNIQNQPIDTAQVKITTNTLIKQYEIHNGNFSLAVPVSLADQEITMEFMKSGLRTHTITHSIPAGRLLEDINVRLYPGYRILLKGRVRVGNMPLEDVNVTIKHEDQVYNQKTLGCYYDSEDYWNCLYLGMFKADITTQNPNDSIKVFFSKSGYNPLLKTLKFAEYDGDLMDIRLNYAQYIPDFPRHNLNLKLVPPLKPLHIGADYKGWFLSMSYLQHISSVNFFRRFSIGAELSVSTSEYSDKFNLLPNENDAIIDSFYIDGYAGPTLKFWIIEPQNRMFSTYIGNTLGFSFKTGDLVNQPYIGTRYFLDLSKAISLELRYLSHQIEITEFKGNVSGSAIRSTKSVLNEKIMVNLGVQVIF
ncbi:MAG: hypothetical protein GVY19_03070 [Bacteroidetes bacterium]|jgi:hypothetical protein|nr:hypothetical protein [Bacteroidota bacterium]